MAATPRDTLDLLQLGAAAIGEMQALGLDENKIATILGQSAERVGRYVRRGNKQRGRPIQKQTEVVIEDGKAVLRSKADNTELRSAEDRAKPPGRDGQSIQTLPMPDITEQYVNVVKAGFGKANKALQGQRVIERPGQDPITVDLVPDNFGGGTIESTKKAIASKEARALAEVGVLDLYELQKEPDRRAAERYDGISEASIAAKAEQQEAYDEKVKMLRKNQPRFENLAGLRYGDTPAEFAPATYTPLRTLEATITQLKQDVAAGQLDLDTPITYQEPTSKRPLNQFGFLYIDEEGNVREEARPPKRARRADVPPVESSITPRRLIQRLEALTPRGMAQADKQQARNTIQRSPISQELADRNQSDFLAKVQTEKESRLREVFNMDALDTSELFADDITASEQQKLDAGLVTDRGLPVAAGNIPDTHQNLNAPETAAGFVRRQIDATEGRAQLYKNARIGEFEVGAPIRDLESRIAGLVNREMRVRDARGIGRVVRPFNQELVDQIGPVRSIDALQKATNLILNVGGEAGIQFPRMVMEEGRMVRDKEAVSGVSEVLDFLKMNAGEQQKLGLALNNLDLGSQNIVAGNVVNAQQKQAFKQGAAMPRPNAARYDSVFQGPIPAPTKGSGDIVFGVRNLPGKGKSTGLNPEAEIELAPEKQARAFRQAQNPDAARGFIGAVKGEVAPVRKAPGMMSPMEIERNIRRKADAGGYEVQEKNIENAKIVAERARRAEEDEAVKRIMLEADVSGSMFPAMRRRY